MIQLNPDCLIFQTARGENIPCSAESVTIELIGEAVSFLDPAVIQNASAAVLHYFKNELDRQFVSVGEFSLALEKVLRGLGLTVTGAAKVEARVEESDLRKLARTAGGGFELFFFSNLRNELREKLNQAPQTVRFNGLRSCVKQLVGAQRWSRRCESFKDQIVEYLRACLHTDHKNNCCALVVL
ncbi:MAG: hypothetical protein M3Y82_03990 [Verrucomicrobiota bacterium]|nr:hypothetical protein [Verrucomicrobiota bacterium]